MAKAILIMEMPSRCIECPCFYEGAHDMCGVMHKRVNLNSKPDWCPLLTEEQAKDTLEKGA